MRKFVTVLYGMSINLRLQNKNKIRLKIDNGHITGPVCFEFHTYVGVAWQYRYEYEYEYEYEFSYAY